MGAFGLAAVRSLGWLLLVVVLAHSAFAVSTAAAGPLLDGPITIQVSVAQPSIRVGDQTVLRVMVTHQPDTQVSFPNLQDRLGSLELIRQQPVPPVRELDGTQRSGMDYVITGFAPGRFRVPAISVQYLLPDGTQNLVTSTDDVVLDVMSVLTSPDEPLRDIKPPVALPRPAAAYARPIATAALLLATLALLAIVIVRWPRRARPAAAAPAVLPEAAARAELGALAGMELVTDADYARFYGSISASVRRYLDARFKLGAMASTTAELRRTIERRGVDSWQARLVSDLLVECDSVKWAARRPDPARARRTLTNALEIVELTASDREPSAAPPAVRSAAGGVR